MQGLTSEQYRLIAENASDLVFQADPDATVLWVSQAIVQVLGWQRSEVLGIHALDLVHPGDVAKMQAIRVRGASGERVADHRVRLRTRDGTYRWMSVRLRAITDPTGAFKGSIVSVTDVHEETMVRRALDTLARGNGVLARATVEDGLLDQLCETIVGIGTYRFAWYGRPVDDDVRSVEVVARAGDDRGYLDGLRLTWGDGPNAVAPLTTAIRTGRLAGSGDLQHDTFTRPFHAAAADAGFQSVLSLPVFANGVLDGVINVYGEAVDEFGSGARALLADLADAFGSGLARLRDHAKLAETFVSSVDLLATAVESRDVYTAGHQSNVSMLSVGIGQVLGLDGDRLRGLELGAKIHDVGKIATPLEVLLKREQLTPDELAEVRNHPSVGWEIANRFPWPWPIAEIIHQHHERLDGSGYPRGLKGGAILLEARIVAVADVYDAMRHDRSYRSSPGKESALEVLTAGRGSGFDPDVVDAFVRVIATGYDVAPPGR